MLDLSIVHDLSQDNRYSFYEGIVQIFYSTSQRLRRKIVVLDLVVSFQKYFKVFGFLNQWWKTVLGYSLFGSYEYVVWKRIFYNLC